MKESDPRVQYVQQLGNEAKGQLPKEMATQLAKADRDEP
jgi:hypothetical protein